MPPLLCVGSEVSSIQSAFSSFLPLEVGKRRRRRKQIYGVIMRSVTEGKWEVRWACGKVEACNSSMIKREGDPTTATLSMVRNVMGR